MYSVTHVLVSLPVAVIKYQNKSSLREKGFIWLRIPGSSPSLRSSQGNSVVKWLFTLHPQSRAESHGLMQAFSAA